MNPYLAAFGAYALAVFAVHLLMVVEFERCPASATAFAKLSLPKKLIFWFIVVPCFSGFPVLAFLSGRNGLAASFAFIAPVALLWARSVMAAGRQGGMLQHA